MSKLHVISDVHTEHFKMNLSSSPSIEAEGDCAALVGDIGDPWDPSYEEYIGYFADKFEKVFVVAGNHEFYNHEYFSTVKQMNEVSLKFPNVTFLHEKSEKYHGIRFIGSTLWSNVPKENENKVSQSLNDYHMISIEEKGEKKRKLQVSDTNKFHKQELDFIKDEIKKAKENNEVVVVLTHHAPLIKGTSNPIYDGDAINCAFSTDLKDLLGHPIYLWAFGHTHYTSEQNVNGTRVLSNQVGYFFNRSKSNYDPKKIIEIPDDVKKLFE
eukprot:gene124-4370_t